MKESQELFVIIAKLIRQSLESFQDGFQVTDIASFLDEAMDVPTALTGLKAVKNEFANATPDDIEDIVSDVTFELSNEVKDQMLLSAIGSALGVVLYSYSIYARK